jgi:hypothetical protein
MVGLECVHLVGRKAVQDPVQMFSHRGQTSGRTAPAHLGSDTNTTIHLSDVPDWQTRVSRESSTPFWPELGL